MTDQFWMNFEYYGCWLVIALSAYVLAYQIWRWSRFLRGGALLVFTSLTLIALAYAILNTAVLGVALNGVYLEIGEYVIKPILWFTRIRMYATAGGISFLAIITTVTNRRMRSASHKEQETVIDAAQIILYSKQERLRADIEIQKTNEYLHSSK